MAVIPLHRLLVAGRNATDVVCHRAGGAVAWRDFTAAVAVLAAQLSARPEKRWLLAENDACDFAVRLFGLLHAGKRAVIPANTQPGTLAALANEYDAVCDDTLPQGEALALAPMDPAQAGISLYTSGSTGSPKRVDKTLAQLEAEIAVLEATWGETLGDTTVLATVPHHHIYGLLFRVLWPLAAGRAFDTVVCAEPDTLQQRIRLRDRHVLVASPAHLSRLPQLTSLAALKRAEIVFSSGGPLPATAARAFREQTGQAPTEVFGSTETGGIAWRRQDENTGDWWTPFPGVRVENAVAGPLLTSPYLPDAEPWPLADAVDLAADGRFRLKGRVDRIAKIEEKRVSLGEVEQRLLEHSWIAEAAVVAMQGARRQSLGVAAVLNAAGRSALAAHGRLHLRNAFREHLARHYEAVLLPRYWRYPEQLPYNAQGKLTQIALIALFDNHDESAAA